MFLGFRVFLLDTMEQELPTWFDRNSEETFIKAIISAYDQAEGMAIQSWTDSLETLDASEIRELLVKRVSKRVNFKFFV